jgi:hypothetical protein
MKRFLEQKLTFEGSEAVYDEFGDPVMMDWETEWMEESAKIICSKGGSILNIGYGLGIIDSFIQTHSIYFHTICEHHPDILEKMRKDGWYIKPNVTILAVRWQDMLTVDTIAPFDAIYFDAYHILNKYDAGGEGFLEGFIPLLPKLLKKHGIFSFWPGPIFESPKVSAIQFRNNLAKALHPTFKLEKKYFKYTNASMNKKRFKFTSSKNFTIPVITYRDVPLKKTLF